MQEKWLKLLAYWQDHEDRQTLTFPFVIGALRTPIGSTQGSEDSARAELGQLLDSVARHKATDHLLHIYRCEDLSKFVLHRVKGDANPPPGAAHVASSAGEVGVLFATGIGNGTVAHGTLLSALWAEGGQAILQGNFSCRGKLFQPFNADEVTMIGRALA